jgi:nicotinamide-nucleotide amidase
MKLEEEVGELLKSKNLSLSTAESCTGGGVAALVTSVPGSSEYFNGGIVAYSNEVKISLLHVSAETLERYGAVSQETVIEMVKGAMKALKTDCAVATSGIAGPGGGTAEKPVGLVYIGCYLNGKTTVKECRFTGNRMENRLHTVETALEMLKERLLTEE